MASETLNDSTARGKAMPTAPPLAELSEGARGGATTTLAGVSHWYVEKAGACFVLELPVKR